MSNVDILTFKITVGANNITSWFNKANTRFLANELPTANMTVANTNGKFNSVILPGQSMVLSASSDGTNFVRLFSGTVVTKRAERGGYGDELMQISAYGGGSIRSLYLAPNQVVIKNKNIGEVFTGSPTDPNGVAWGISDSNGYWPDGLLYRTGYHLSPDSVVDVFASTLDVPFKIVKNQTLLSDAIKYMADTYGLLFFIDDINSHLSVYTDSALGSFPTLSYTLSYGKNISTIDVNDDGLEQYDSVLVVGRNSDIFYRSGSGKREYFLRDESITDRRVAIEKAAQMYNIYCQTKKTIRIGAPPITHSIIGRRITLNDSIMGVSAYGNVVGVEHSIAAKAWTTDVTIESPARSQAKILSEIKKQVKDDETNKEKGEIFLSGITTPNTYYVTGGNNIVAIGFGTKSTVNQLELEACIKIKPFSSLVSDSTGKYVYGIMDGPSCRLKEITIYANKTTENAMYESSTVAYVPRTGDTNPIPFLTISKTGDGLYPTSISSIVAKNETGSFVTPFYKTFMAKRVVSIGLVTAYTPYAIPHPTHSYWAASGTTLYANATTEEKRIASIDNGFGFYRFLPSLGESYNYDHIMTMVEFDTGLTGDARKSLRTIRFHYRTENFKWRETYPETIPIDMTVNLWIPSSAVWSELESVSSDYPSTWHYSGFYGNLDGMQWIDDDGMMRFCFYTNDTAFNDMYQGIHYFAVCPVFDERAGRLVTTTEQANWDEVNRELKLSLKPVEILGIYTAGNKSAEGIWTGAGTNWNFRVTGTKEKGVEINVNPLYSIMKFKQVNEGGYADDGMYMQVWVNPLMDYINSAGNAFVKYTYYDTFIEEPLKVQTIPENSYIMSYSTADGAQAVVYMKVDENAPAYYETPLTVKYLAVNGEPIARFTVSANTRANAGIAKTADNKIYFVGKIVVPGTSSGITTLSGFGLESVV
jgi:hypothetical protein